MSGLIFSSNNFCFKCCIKSAEYDSNFSLPNNCDIFLINLEIN